MHVVLHAKEFHMFSFVKLYKTGWLGQVKQVRVCGVWGSGPEGQVLMTVSCFPPWPLLSQRGDHMYLLSSPIEQTHLTNRGLASITEGDKQRGILQNSREAFQVPSEENPI